MTTSNSDKDAAQRVLLEQMQAAIEGYWSWSSRKDEALRIADDADDQMESFKRQAHEIQSVGIRIGFNLFDIANNGVDDDQAAKTTRAVNPPPNFSIKNYVLAALRDAYPRAMKAADIKQQLSDMGHEIHPKTIGMTLYRWSLQGAVFREGLDWIFIPEDKRQPPEDAQTEEAPLDVAAE